MRYVNEIDLKGKKVLVRLDFNVPLKDGKIQDDNRIKAALPTIKYLIDQGAKLILCSHLGKPKGKVVPDLSLTPVANRLSELLKKEVKMAPSVVGKETEALVENLKEKEILLLENLRFHPGETKNDPEFSKELAKLADVYVNDAFGVVHRAHASVVGVTEYIKEKCAGFLIKKEVEYLRDSLESPKRPFVLISGGAKVSTKIGVINNLILKVDRIIIGGAMANTFRKAQGYPIGKSLVEEDYLEEAKRILNKAKELNVGFYLPVDYVMGESPDAEKPSGVFPYQNIDQQSMILDTGPASHVLFSEVLKEAKTVVWNGPMGAFENPAFSQGSFGLAQSVSSVDGLVIVGGGDTDALIHKCNIQDKVSFISTGGGSFLEFLEGKELPGLKALE